MVVGSVPLLGRGVLEASDYAGRSRAWQEGQEETPFITVCATVALQSKGRERNSAPPCSWLKGERGVEEGCTREA